MLQRLTITSNRIQEQEQYLHEIFRSNCFSWLTVFFQVNGDIPPRLKKSAHEIILEFIRSRPPLNPVSSTHDAHNLSSRLGVLKNTSFLSMFIVRCVPSVVMVITVPALTRVCMSHQVSARKLKPHPPRPRSLHERLLEDIKAERKLRPVSPDMIRRSRLGELMTAEHTHCSSADIHAQIPVNYTTGLTT